MNQYLLTTYVVDGEHRQDPGTPEDMQMFMERVMALEAEMDEAGAFVFGGALHGSGDAKVLRPGESEVFTTDGPFAETKEQIGGFYIINAPDLDTALGWASKVTQAIGRPIELRPFSATGKVADQMR
jgi:hypothetical protein